MIPRAHITEWRQMAPWPNDEQVEQDLLICYILCELYNDEFLSESLAFRGGTALHKLYLAPQPRYSEDIDLVQIEEEPIKPIIRRLREKLKFLGEPGVKQNRNNNTLKFRVPSEMDPETPLHIKLEINCREHFTVMGFASKTFDVSSSWFTGNTQVTTYKLEELIGTKLRALYQRSKSRDLYDIFKILTSDNELHSDLILTCYHEYMSFSDGTNPTRKQFIRNLDRKIQDDEFTGDITALLRTEEDFNWQKACDLVKEKLIQHI